MSVREVIHKYARIPFRYGADCCTFVGECLEAAGLRNPMRDISYEGEGEATEIVSSYGTLSDAITAHMGKPLDDVADARENDVVVCLTAGDEIVGIVHVTDVGVRCVLRTKHGVVDWPLQRAQRAWRARA